MWNFLHRIFTFKFYYVQHSMRWDPSYKHVLAAALGLVMVIPAAQATSLSGTVSGRLTLAQSPFTVTADITVPIGQSLAIDPGVVVMLSPNTNFIVNGSLQALGLSSAPIIISSLKEGTTQAAPGQWGNFQFNKLAGRILHLSISSLKPPHVASRIAVRTARRCLCR